MNLIEQKLTMSLCFEITQAGEKRAHFMRFYADREVRIGMSIESAYRISSQLYSGCGSIGCGLIEL